MSAIKFVKKLISRTTQNPKIQSHPKSLSKKSNNKLGIYIKKYPHLVLILRDTVESNFVAIFKFDGHYDHRSMLLENFFRSREY